MHPRMLFTVAPASQCPQPSASTSSPEETGGAGGATSAGGADVPMTPAEKPSHSKDEMEEDADIAEEELKMVCIPARVGEAVDIVGQVGRQPKTITAFQTHTTPVLLSYSERAELASDECKSRSKQGGHKGENSLHSGFEAPDVPALAFLGSKLCSRHGSEWAVNVVTAIGGGYGGFMQAGPGGFLRLCFVLERRQ